MNELELVGCDLEVPLTGGGTTRYVNLDYAASTPAMKTVLTAVESFLPYYSSVHRGAGYKSLVSTEVYEAARRVVSSFLNAQSDSTVIFTRNTTDGLNLLAAALPEGASVLTFASEHHANLLAWSRAGVQVHYLPIPLDQTACVESAVKHLRSNPTTVLAVTGASNVTGELWPIAELAQVAHAHGAAIVVDGAQLAPHAPIDMKALEIDYLAISGHKMYAPFGVGALVGRTQWLKDRVPYLRGGGAVKFVTTQEVLWAGLPDRQEAGSPNVVGAVALAAALRELSSYGMNRVWDHDHHLGSYARERLSAIDGVEVYQLWPSASPRTGIALFNVRRYHHSLVAAILSAEYGIGVRHGCFCAHPLIAGLLRLTDGEVEDLRSTMRSEERTSIPGAVRASVGIDSTEEDIDRLVDAVEGIAKYGPRTEFVIEPSSGEYIPAFDDRPRPDLGLLLTPGMTIVGGESS